jgi:hypothetical protein
MTADTDFKVLFTACNKSWLELKDAKDKIVAENGELKHKLAEADDKLDKLSVEVLRLEYMLSHHSAGCMYCGGSSFTFGLDADGKNRRCQCACHSKNEVKHS